jgi:hypothetical protein
MADGNAAQEAWGRAFAKTDQQMGRAPAPAPDAGPARQDPPAIGASVAERIDDLSARVDALERPRPDAPGGP